jgi:NAD+ synthase
VADAIGVTPDDVQRVYDDIDQKRRTTRYLHLPPLLVDRDGEIPAGHP